MVGSNIGYPDKVHNGLCAISDVGVFLFRRHAYGADSTGATNDVDVRDLDEVACCGVLLGSDTGLWCGNGRVEARCSFHPASTELVRDGGTGNGLDGCMAMSDSAPSGRSVPGVVVLAPLSVAGEFAAETLRQRLVDLEYIGPQS